MDVIDVCAFYSSSVVSAFQAIRAAWRPSPWTRSAHSAVGEQSKSSSFHWPDGREADARLRMSDDMTGCFTSFNPPTLAAFL